MTTSPRLAPGGLCLSGLEVPALYMPGLEQCRGDVLAIGAQVNQLAAISIRSVRPRNGHPPTAGRVFSAGARRASEIPLLRAACARRAAFGCIDAVKAELLAIEIAAVAINPSHHDRRGA